MPIPQADAEWLRSQGIDPNTVTPVREQTTTEPGKEKMTALQAAMATGKAHAGGYVGGGLGTLGTLAGLSWLAGPEVGLPATLLAGAVGGAAGAYGGQKVQSKILKDQTTQSLEEQAAEAQKEHPFVSGATDVVGSALASGGKPSISNIPKALMGNKEAMAKIALGSVVNPAINAGIDYAATGQTPTISSLAQQAAGGALFSEQSRLGRMMSVNHPGVTEPQEEPTKQDHTLDNGQTSEQIQKPTSPYTETDANGISKFDSSAINALHENYLNSQPSKQDLGQMSIEDAQAALTKYRIGKGLSEEAKRQALEQMWLEQNKPTPSQAEPQAETGARTIPRQTPINPYSDEAYLNDQAETHLTDANKEPSEAEKAAQLDLQQRAMESREAVRQAGGVVNDAGQNPLLSKDTDSAAISKDPNSTDNTQGQVLNEKDKQDNAKLKQTLAFHAAEAAKEDLTEQQRTQANQKLAETQASLQRHDDFMKAKLEMANKSKGGPTPKEVVPNPNNRVNPEKMMKSPTLQNKVGLLPQDLSKTPGLDEIIKRHQIELQKQEGEKGVPFEQEGGGKNIEEDWDTKLQKLKFKSPGLMEGSIVGIPMTIWNGSIDAVRTAVKAGKHILLAVQDGIDWIKKNHPTLKFNEEAYRNETINRLKGGKENATNEGQKPTSNQQEHSRVQQGTDLRANEKEIREGQSKETSNRSSLQPSKEVTLNTRSFKGTSAAIDKIRTDTSPKAPKISDAFKSVLIKNEQRVGETWNKFYRKAESLGIEPGSKESQHLWELGNRMNETGEQPKPEDFLNAREAKLWKTYQQVYDEMGKHRIAIKEPVYNQDGSPRNLKQDPNHFSTPVAPKVIETFKKGTDKEAMASYKKSFIDNLTQNHDVSEASAEQMFNSTVRKFKGSITDPHSNMAWFAGNRLSEGYGLPRDWQVPDFIKSREVYMRRAALDNAFYEHVESNPEIMGALGETKDPWKQDIPKKFVDETGGIANNPNVRSVLNQFHGTSQDPVGRTEHAFSSLASALFVSAPTIKAHIIGTNINGVLRLADNPRMLANMLFDGLKNINEGILHTDQNGVAKATSVRLKDMFSNMTTGAQKIQALTQFIRKVGSAPTDLIGLTDKNTQGWMQAAMESALPSKVQRANDGNITQQQYLKKLDPTYTTGKQYDEKGISQLASQALGYIHGVGDARTMPSWMLSDSETSGFFQLAHWSIAQTNSFMSDVLTPALKGDLKPLLISIAGSTVAGALIKEMREEIQGKKSAIPSMSEIAASDKGLEGNKTLIAYNLITALQYAGFAGLFSQIAKYPFDTMYKNTSQGAIFPLDEIASDLVTSTKQFFSAKANDPNFDLADATKLLASHLLTQNIQMARIGYNQAINSGLITGTLAEKKQLADKLAQLRRFDMVSGLPFDDSTSPTANPYMNVEQKAFKKTQNPEEAMDMLPKLIDNIVDTYGSNPDVMREKLKALKQNMYETFPSLENMPLEFSKYMDYLTKLKGPEQAQSELEDYMTHRAINKAKASAVP